MKAPGLPISNPWRAKAAGRHRSPACCPRQLHGRRPAERAAVLKQLPDPPACGATKSWAKVRTVARNSSRSELLLLLLSQGLGPWSAAASADSSRHWPQLLHAAAEAAAGSLQAGGSMSREG